MPDNVLWRLNGYGTMGTMRLNEPRVKYGLDYFLDHFFGPFFLDHFIRGGSTPLVLREVWDAVY